ncbi:UxaA family hydrolase [Desulforhopalus sp. 52FAK]
MSQKRYLKIDETDTLVVALQTLPQGVQLTIDGVAVQLQESIPEKQKFALVDFKPGDRAVMYGVTVGEATEFIPAGGKITTSNLKHATSLYSESGEDFSWDAPASYEGIEATFMGYRRKNGKAGTANFWIFVPLVFCSNQELNLIKDVLPRALGYQKSSKYEQFTETLVERVKAGEDVTSPVIAIDSFDQQQTPLFPNVDGVRFLTHSVGCGNTPEDIDSLYALLANYITHPNVAGASVISLGCQKAELVTLKEQVALRDPEGLQEVHYYERQSWKEPQDMLEAMIQDTMEGLQKADGVNREPIPIGELIVGVECGGSDGFSGISANPVIGRTIDHLVAAGGSGMLSEFPELCGVENELVMRCVTRDIADRFLHLVSSYRKRVQQVGSDFDLNPSPGNIRDGLITDAMKSAGAAKKGGTSPIVDVLDYAESNRKKGLTLLCTPGSDVESTTALVGAGANLVIFSTGLGTPTGNPIVPVLKVATNSSLAERLDYMIDCNCGPIITGEKSIDDLACELLKMCIETASGRYEAKATRLGQEDFIPWKRGVSL